MRFFLSVIMTSLIGLSANNIPFTYAHAREKLTLPEATFVR